MESRPAVSVLMPAWRAEPCIARAVASLLAQDLADWELVIASDDGTDYLAQLAARGVADARLRQVPTGRHGSGCAAARNAALDAAKGAFVTPLDADDLFAPDRLSRLLPVARRHGAVIDNVAAVEESSLAALSHLLPPEETPARLDAERFLATWVPAKPLVDAALGLRWDPDTGLSDDIVYVMQLVDRLGPLPYVARPLQEYRVGEGSLCHSANSVAIAETGYQRLLSRLDDGSLDIADATLRQTFRDGIEAKRRLNQAFGEAEAAGFAGTFQHFAAASGTRELAARRA